VKGDSDDRSKHIQVTGESNTGTQVEVQGGSCNAAQMGWFLNCFDGFDGSKNRTAWGGNEGWSDFGEGKKLS
jgi:hypothetical protein